MGETTAGNSTMAYSCWCDQWLLFISACMSVCIECLGQLLAWRSLGLQMLSLIYTRVILPWPGWQRCRAGPSFCDCFVNLKCLSVYLKIACCYWLLILYSHIWYWFSIILPSTQPGRWSSSPHKFVEPLSIEKPSLAGSGTAYTDWAASRCLPRPALCHTWPAPFTQASSPGKP